MRPSRVPAAILPILWAALLTIGCSEEDTPYSDDFTPPAAVTDLAVAGVDPTTISLSWTATGDDELRGTAADYDLRYSTGTISDTSWSSAVKASGEPAPREAGESESFVVTGLESDTPYSFAVVVFDDSMNPSGLSNVVSARTSPEIGDDSNWWDGFGDGLDGAVYAMAVYGHTLVAGGAFHTAGRENVNRIASFDGTVWSSLGEGLNGEVWALTVHNGELVAGGSFRYAGSGPAHYIARWDGYDWSPLGSGMNSSVMALTSWQGDLVAGGFFTTAGGEEAPYLARWDGSSWHSIPGLDGPVYAVAAYNGDLIAGGRFEVADGITVRQIADWDGNEWHPFGGGFFVSPPPASVSALTVHEGNLFAGGYFTSADVTPANAIAGWNGVEWGPLGTGISEEVLTLASYGGLVAGGRFDVAGETPVGQIARWNGSAWIPFGSGIGPELSRVQALAEYDGALYVGGFFETAGGKPSRNIARWKDR